MVVFLLSRLSDYAKTIIDEHLVILEGYVLVVESKKAHLVKILFFQILLSKPISANCFKVRLNISLRGI